MLVIYTLFGIDDKVKTAINRIRQFEPPEGYYVAFSGGKDSVSIKALCDMANVKYDAHYNLTTVDPPELIYFIREHHPDVIIDKPTMTMWELIEQKGVPTRIQRFCCSYLKERGGEGRFCITGVRWAESVKRRKERVGLELNFHTNEEIKIMFTNDNTETRRLLETCVMKSKHTLNPIIDWSDDDVWQFIKQNNIPYCKLYDEGFKRLGCIGCPMGQKRGRLQQFVRWPKYYYAYLRAFDRMLQKRAKKGIETPWETAQEVMDWWIYETPIRDQNQGEIFEFEEVEL